MVRLELKKLRHKRYWLIAVVSLLLQAMWTTALLFARGNGPEQVKLMALGLTDVTQLATLLIAITAALLASRLVTVDTEGRMDQAFAAVGQREGTRFTAKLVVGAGTLIVMQLIVFAAAMTIGPSVGLRIDESSRHAAPWTCVVLIAASIAAMAASLCLSRLLEKQGIGLGIAGLAGAVLSGLQFAGLESLGWLFPWGVIVAAGPVDAKASLDSIAAGGLAVVSANAGFKAIIGLAISVIWALVARSILVRKESKA